LILSRGAELKPSFRRRAKRIDLSFLEGEREKERERERGRGRERERESYRYIDA